MSSKPYRSGMWPTTHWTLVHRAGKGNAEERRIAIASLVGIYLPVLRWHLLIKRNVKSSQADDILQDFLVSRILEKEILTLADRGRGRFRAFLATALDRYLINLVRGQNAAKRVVLRCDSPNGLEVTIPDAKALPSDLFDFLWARQVIGQTVRHMRARCASLNRPDLWGVFRGRVLRPALGSHDPTDFNLLVNQFDLGSRKRAWKLLFTANQMFRSSLFSVIGRYDAGRTDVLAEINDLRNAVSKSKRIRG